MSDVTAWVAEKLAQSEQQLKVVGRTPEGFLVIEAEDEYKFLVAVLGVRDVIQFSHVQPLFVHADKPQLIVNVPSKALWSREAINFIHSVPAAFGAMGDIGRAAETKAASSYRDKNMGFFIRAMKQHKNVSDVSYLYDSVFQVDRKHGPSLTVAVTDAYNMSAEDVRNARTRVGRFDIVVKSTSYGSITEQANATAESLGAQALTFRELMLRLSK